MGVYKEMKLQGRDKKNGRPQDAREREDPLRELATKLAWAVGSVLEENYRSGSPLKRWAERLAQQLLDHHENAARKGGVPGSR